MQVMVFISKAADNPHGHRPTLLVLPSHSRAAIPKELQHLEWSYFADTTPDDELLGGKAANIQDTIERQGYAQVPVPRK